MGTLAVNDDLVGLLQSRFGHAGFRRGQRELVEAAAGGRDTLAILPTGAGKSLCYQIMPLVRPGLTIVITPPGTFVHEQMSMLNRIGIAADTLSAGQSFRQQRAVVERVESGEVRVLYLGAETVSGHSDSLFPWLSGLPVGLVAVDEAHCVTEWGYQFCPDYRVLGVLRESLDAPFMAVTGTATPECKDDIIKQLGLRDPLVQIESFVRPNLRYSVLQRPSDRMGALAEVVSGHEGRGPAVVYSESRDEVVELARLLRAEGLEARAYHEGMEGEERLRREIDFYAGRISVMVATKAFGMGIAKSNVRLVLHCQTPSSIERYYQESGRAGHDGKVADCVLFAGRLDQRNLELEMSQIPGVSVEATRWREAAMERAGAILGYVDGGGCRQVALVSYFGEQNVVSCGSCDICAEASQRPRPPVGRHWLFDELARWRDGFAQQYGYNSRELFADETLRSIARLLPRNRADLSKIWGVGKRKAMLYELRDFGPGGKVFGHG